MLKQKRLQLFTSALVVAVAFAGCQSRQQQPGRYQPGGGTHLAPATNQLLTPVPDALPSISGPGHAKADESNPVKSTSTRPRRGLFKLLPSFRRRNDASFQNEQEQPHEGRILTEEEFNALPGTAVTLSPDSFEKMPRSLEPSMPTTMTVPQSGPMEQSKQEPAPRSDQAGLSVRSVSSVVEPSPRPGLIRDFGPQYFEDVSSLNFGGAWGQVVDQPRQQQQVTTANADPLEIANIDESYDLWPKAPTPSQTADPTQMVASPTMPTMPTMPGPSSPEMVAMESTSYVRNPPAAYHASVEQPVLFAQPSIDSGIDALPVIVPSSR